MTEYREIAICDVGNVRFGNAENDGGKTGVTVIVFPEGARGGVEISGGGPASRETPLLSPVTADNLIHAVTLSGGSAFGLDAGTGVVRCLEERGIGYDTGFARVPLVCQSCLYDLGYGSSRIRPDAALGYQAAVNALEAKTQLQSGNYGAGLGATVGKLAGMKRAMKAGLGVFAAQVGNLKVGAVTAVNALGDIFDGCTGEKLAGILNEDRDGFGDSVEEALKLCGPTDLFAANTTLSVILTNACFHTADLNKIARIAGNAYGKCIRPVGTMADGDTIYAFSVGEQEADINAAGVLADLVLCRAIGNAVRASRISDEEYLEQIRMG